MNQIFNGKDDFVEQFKASCTTTIGKSVADCTDAERFQALATLIAAKSREVEVATDQGYRQNHKKKVYYFSLEFLIGPLLDNYLINYGIRDMVDEALADMGLSLGDIERQEVDPGLGNGGLGRLAACFMDSLAHEGIAGYGNGMRYRYGLFHQAIKDGCQVEETDNWLANGFPWEIRRAQSAVTVTFGGEVVRHEGEDGSYWFTVEGGQKVKAVPYDVPIVGYGGKTVNKLRLWSAEPAEEDFDLDAFNEGKYAKANKFRSDAEAISTILYPNDAGEHGRILRVKQEYLFVSAGLQTILRSYEHEYGPDWEHFPDHVSLHTNDTHPAMCGPELMRLLVDERKLDWDTAWDIVTRSVSYTNHTVMPEALETWPIEMFRPLVPRIYMYIDEINRRYIESLKAKYADWQRLAAETAVLWDGRVRMANLSIICGHSVNGVSAIHSEILKHDVLKGFYETTPEKFNNKTNGVSHRRFLGEANPPLSRVITEAIGDRWMDDAFELAKLEKYKDDASFLDSVVDAKYQDKVRLAAYVKETSGVELDPHSTFDVQVKRFHAYKRQLLNVFKVLDLYNRMIDDPSFKPLPTSFIFAGKAAQSYTFAKETIRLINSMADVINNDPRVNDTIKVAFVPNYSISSAQIVNPAAEISEQISTAGMEGSGTSNMKFMYNGAIMLGTYDGANIEIAELVGEENIKIFGNRVEDIERIRREGYWAWDEVNSDPRLGRVVNQLVDGSLARLNGNFDLVHDELMTNNDQWFVLKDFQPYVKAFEELRQTCDDPHTWARMSLINTARAGKFSSDRTIREYAEDIWKA